MPLASRRYTIRRQVFKLFGAAFHVYDGEGNLLGYSKQKAFKLKEDIRVYADESLSQPLLTIAARNVIDFSAAYDMVDAQTGENVGTARRKGWSSIFRDSWELLDTDEGLSARVQEDSAFMAFLRRFLSNWIPQKFIVQSEDGTRHAVYDQHFNPFIYRLTVTLSPDTEMDPRLILGSAILIAAIEGRQG